MDISNVIIVLTVIQNLEKAKNSITVK